MDIWDNLHNMIDSIHYTVDDAAPVVAATFEDVGCAAIETAENALDKLDDVVNNIFDFIDRIFYN